MGKIDWENGKETDFHTNDYHEKITSVIFEDTISIPENTISWDVSEKTGSKSVMAWLTSDPNDNANFVLHIGGEGGVVANPDSSNLFYYFYNLKQ